MGIGEFAKRTTIANVVSAIVVITGLVILAFSHDNEAIKYVMASAIGYLFGRSGKQES